MNTPRTPQSKRRSDAGETLLEVLIAMIIFGGAISALLAGIATVALGSASHRTEASANALLRSYSEAVKRSARDTYRPCPLTTTYPIDTADYVKPTGWATPVNTVTCSGADVGVQQVRITVTAPKGEQQKLEIWVRKP